MAALLCFWGGIQNSYWAFAHNPYDYAASVSCPTLLLYGENDDRVSLEETESIYEALQGVKQIKIFKGIGHDVFAESNRVAWTKEVSRFVSRLN
jgi:dipeptidyl aminopeptidase/acylaminoacyl peptidase